MVSPRAAEESAAAAHGLNNVGASVRARAAAAAGTRFWTAGFWTRFLRCTLCEEPELMRSSCWLGEIATRREDQFDGGGNLARHRPRHPARLPGRGQGYASQADCGALPH